MEKKKTKNYLVSFLRFLLGPKLLFCLTWAFARAKGGLVLFSGLFIIIGILYISSPNRLVIDKYGDVNGVINQLRLYTQGRKFLYNQLDLANAIIHSNGSSDRSIAYLMEEVEDQMESVERSMGLSSELSRADILRREADRIERRNFVEYIERLRQRRIEDCNSIIPYVQSLIRLTGPSNTPWILLGCFVFAITFIVVLMYPNPFRKFAVDPEVEPSNALKHYLDELSADDLKSKTIIYHLHGIQARLAEMLTNEGIEDETVGVSFPYFNNGYLARGLVRQLSKDYVGASKDYDDVFRDGISDPTASYYYFSGTAYYHLRNYDASLNTLDFLIHFYKAEPSTYYFRGLTKLRLNNENGARIDFKIACERGYSRAEMLLKLLDLHELSLR